MRANEPLVMALPKGRILTEVMPLVRKAGIEPEAAFDDPASRALQFETNIPNLRIIRVRSFDVATFIANGAAHLGVAGNDVLMEFDYAELYAPVDLKIGRCRLSVAAPPELIKQDDPSRWSHIRVATKYPNVTRRHFAARGVQAECIKLHGAMELAPNLALYVLGSTLLFPVGLGEFIKPLFNLPIDPSGVVLYFGISILFLVLTVIYLRNLKIPAKAAG